MPTLADLRRQLQQLDQQSYGAYKRLQRRYEAPNFTLLVDRVQGDPFAAPSQFRVQMPLAVAALPPPLYGSRSRKMALCDYLTRQFDQCVRSQRQQRGSGHSGLIAIAAPQQTVLERSSVLLLADDLEVRFVVGLPAFGRRVAGYQAAEMLCEDLPELCDRALRYCNLDAVALQQHVETVEDADWLRDQLAQRGLVAFVANGAQLARRSGVDDRPALDNCPFQSPAALQVSFDCPNRGQVSGLGIPQGITLIVGGGYHGKSTLLRAIEVGVYNHIPGDGREWVVTDPTAVKIRAEDGRSVTGVDISPFIANLPLGRSTCQFSTENASGSTSQAANMMEALEAGSRLLLVDEDTAATNLMIRDRRMQALIAKVNEPITPFVDRVRGLYRDLGVSTILVMGGSGDYLDVADHVIAMVAFEPQEVTEQARAVVQHYPTQRLAEGGAAFAPIRGRRLTVPQPSRERVKWKTIGVEKLVLDREDIHLAQVEQLVDPAQLRAIAATLVYLQTHELNGSVPLPTLLDRVMAELTEQGWDRLTTLPSGELAAFRRFELAAAINRWRSLRLSEHQPGPRL